MSEELDIEGTEEEDEEGSQTIWEMLKLDDPGDEPYAEEEDHRDEVDEKADKLTRKLASKMDNMSKKFEHTMLRERTKTYTEHATELELDLFKTIAADVKNLEDFDRATALVKDRAVKMQAEADKYQAQMEASVAAATAAAWGSGPIGTPAPKGDADLKERASKIAKGDTHAALSALLDGDKMVGGIV